MIYITGDTHIPKDIGKLSEEHFKGQKDMTKKDYVIICGDFGGVWDGSNEEKYWLKWLKNKNFTTLFIDGNHENFEMLNSMPKKKFLGGTVHKIDDGIYHLMRGEIYTIENKKFFTFGGASTYDKESRTEGKNWWKEEMPNKEEYEKANNNLSECNFKVDYIITHSAPTSLHNIIVPKHNTNEITNFLEEIKNKTSYTKWFFGHYHKDEDYDEKHTVVFDKKIII